MFECFKRKRWRENGDEFGYFGKFHSCPDFIKVNVNNVILAELERWFQCSFAEFVERYNTSAACLFNNKCRHNYLYFGAQQRVSIIGVVLASCDQSRRDYPLVTFRVLSNVLMAEFSCAIPLIYAAYFARLQTAKCLHRSTVGLAQFDHFLSEALLLPSDFSRYEILNGVVMGLKDISLYEYWRLVIAGGDCQYKQFVAAINMVIQRVSSLEVGQRLCVKLPVCTVKYCGLLTTFWLQLFASLPLKISVSSVFWSDSDLLVFFGEHSSEMFVDLLGTWENSDCRLDLLQLTNDIGVEMRCMCEPDISLFDFSAQVSALM